MSGEQFSETEVADPLAPIPLKYEPLRRVGSRILPLAVRRPMLSSWQRDLCSLLLVQAATAYRLRAECTLTLGHFGRSLRYVSLGFLCIGTHVRMLRLAIC